ncbi:Cof subfamily protein (haloacid dehalogenase superfamily) [Weissella uvarum]|uniref:HAD-IIB family hydrolase n=1 Tax=Weissella uvarum TaxID=1479233 RepID=UPI001960E1CD|nr:HAD-IIB family hydrolase [Weissella uvarum]MBM7617704.1 Cof subfamily protein (haloacid dehalogenase superfamily) [Weissella uvarum]MCM0596053.1 HAD-IIB family hydrolase [Weissella uvarum]
MKFIATDLDGTFLDDQKHYDADLFQQTLNRLADEQTRFVIATGRELKWIQAMFGEFTKQVDIVASNGAVVKPQDHPMIRKQISVATLADLQAFLDERQAVPSGGLRTYTDNEMYTLKGMGELDAQTYAFMEKLYDKINEIDSLAELPEPVSTVTGRWSDNHDDGYRVMQAINDSDLPLYATTSGYGTVDILPEGVNKAFALETLLQTVGDADTNQLAAFGDGMNDYEMLQLADAGYVMPNGDEFLLKQPEFKHVAEDNNHSGVLKTILNW